MKIGKEFSNRFWNPKWHRAPTIALGLCLASSALADAVTVSGSSVVVTDTPATLQLPPMRNSGVGYTPPLHWLNVTTSTPVFGRPIPGNWFDRAHSGHGFDFQLFALDPTNGKDVYFLTFYTYENDGTSEWYQAAGSLVNGIFVASPQANGNTLYRLTYKTSPTAIISLALDNSLTGSVSVDFNQTAQSPACLNMDRSNALQLAVMSWHIGNDSGQWCVEPIVAPTAHPSPDLNGHWYAPSDSGWGMEILDVSTGTGSAPAIIVYMYYPGPNGQPTWATASGTLNNGTASMQLLQVSNGYCRTCTPPPQLVANNIGTITLTFSQAKSGGAVPTGSASILANYPGGGGFNRPHISTQMLSMPFVSTGPLMIQPLSGSGQHGVAFTLPAPVISGGAQPYHFRFDTLFNGAPPPGSAVDLFTGGVSIPKSALVGTYKFYICVDDIGGESKCAQATAIVGDSGVSQKPNLTPYQPQGWSDKIVVSNVTGTNTDSSLLRSTDTLYVNWAVINNGSASTSVTFNTDLYVDGVLDHSWYTDPPMDPTPAMGPATWQNVVDYSIGSLSAGSHTIKIVTDSDSTIDESNESDNQYTKVINIGSNAALTISLVSGAGQHGVAFRLPAPVVSGGVPPYHFQFDSFINGAPPLGSAVDLFTGVVSIPSSALAGTYTFNICVVDIGGQSSCAQATAIVAAAADAVLTWTVGDQCSSGAQMYYKFFDLSANLVWPAPPSAYVASYGQSFQSQLNCTSGHQICLGAQSGSYSWGVGLNGTGSCTVSGTCGQGPYSNNLTCGSTGGTSYYANWSCGSSSQCASVMGGYAGSKGPFCSSAACQAWGNQIPGGYSCSTNPTYTPDPGGSQCYNYP